MSKMRFTLRLGFFGLHRRPISDYFLIILLTYDIKNHYLSLVIFLDILRAIITFSKCHSVLFRGGAIATSLIKFRVLTSLLTSRVSCVRP